MVVADVDVVRYKMGKTVKEKNEGHQTVSTHTYTHKRIFVVTDNEDSPQQIQRRRPRGRPRRGYPYSGPRGGFGYRPRGGPPRGGPPRGGPMRRPMPRGPPPDGPVQVCRVRDI